MSNNPEVKAVAVEAPVKQLSRDELRAAIFANTKPKTLEVEFFGQKLELRQPTVGEVEELQRDESDRKHTAINTLIRYAYVPGTEEKAFDDADIEALRALPWGKDFTNVVTSIAELTGIDIGSGEKN